MMVTELVEIDGQSDLSALIGQRSEFRSADGRRMVGTIKRFDGLTPVVRFDDGQWGYGAGEVLANGNVELSIVLVGP